MTLEWLEGKGRSVKAGVSQQAVYHAGHPKQTFSFQSWHQLTVYLGWAIGLFCVSKGDNANFVYMWANVYPFTIPVTFIQDPARGICEREGNCQDWLSCKIFWNLLMDTFFFKVLLQLSRDISNLRLNHNLDCRFWGYKIQSWTWRGTKLRCSWLFVFYCRNISFVWIKGSREGLGKGMLPVVIKFPECKPLKSNLYPLYFCYQ